MKNGKITLFATAFVALSSAAILASCAPKYDVKLVIYNWEDYIYEGTDEDGNIVDDSLVEMFEDYYKEKTGQVLKVFYEGFSTNEEIYQQIKLGAINQI